MAAKTRMYPFEFRGRAEIVRRAQGPEPALDESQIVIHLNDNSMLIAQAVQGELIRGLSPSLSVQAQIHFYEGSIVFAGVVILLDALGAVTNSPDFPTTFSRLVEIVVQGVLQKRILGEIDTDHFTPSIQVEVTQPMPLQRNGWMSLQNLAALMIVNLVLLLILTFLLISSRLSNPTPTPTQIPTNTPVILNNFDLHSRATDASWVGSGGAVTFGGPDTDTNGFAMYRNNQKVEDGTSPIQVLEIYPQWVNDGAMTGLYPAYTVLSGARFKAKLGFLALNDGSCGSGNAKFQLNYKEGAVMKPLGEWTDICDGVLKDIDLDLSSLAGRTVQFVLAVLANGQANQDTAVWVSPRIESP